MEATVTVSQKPMTTALHGAMMTTVITVTGKAPIAIARSKSGVVAFISGVEVSVSSFANKLRTFADAGINMAAVAPVAARFGIEY
ncbi:hypothetical protein [Deinococcus soli (ex Cha et al. 2016)]|uniref:Uncharacterized protein n=2 Tax=Deinococcus soli (ex Cha et al. 2016) TaxID=1309411 RepID=A0ACC6KG82_9DEIO|nr:hypothetical protein [Deinococcus soli (ex Cha et al. 2016)]MDR6218193.1 hypothetical protein [Deinococcus soli (ex Cha et al. 2016)]MDR6328933.1 hypothetical protein [Deinococcus soli (ex Cha et al. 2016)]MDR6751579.1 hypothetical protein [Deinococcus soli (ex Cha et al. 2016)]